MLVSYWSELRDFPLVFIPLFVAMDPLGLLPFVVGILEPRAGPRRGRVIRTAMVTGSVIGLVFLALGQLVFQVLGIDTSDFLMAGGAVLFILSLRDLASATQDQPVAPDELLAVVPIGTPLLVGPAAISLLILLAGLYPLWLVLLGFLTNIGVAWVLLLLAHHIQKLLGIGGLRAFSKVASLLLAAIAVQLVRRGIAQVLGG
ncbi:MAG: MarC family protein [Chloroflexi bacterium]|nr:MarC family protein [Chloroflexota bacterium]